MLPDRKACGMRTQKSYAELTFPPLGVSLGRYRGLC